MGLGFVLLIWAIAGCVVAVIGAAAVGAVTAWLTRGSTAPRGKLIAVAALFPLACLVWAGGIFVFQGLVNEELLHRDFGIGDGWCTPLPNGYRLLMIDVTDQGWVYNPKTQDSESDVVEKEDAVDRVRDVQVTNRYIPGAADHYFLLDTTTGRRTEFPAYAALDRRARELNISLHLRSIYSVYFKYRFGWFDLLAGLMLLCPPLAGGGLLLLWIVPVRRTHRIIRPLVANSPVA